MRVPAAATRQSRPAIFRKRDRHGLLGLANLTAQPCIRRFASGPDILQIQRTCTSRIAVVQVLQPRKIIDMPVFTGHQKAGGDCLNMPALAVGVDIPGTLGPLRIGAKLEQAA